jgi:hypothetical protein
VREVRAMTFETWPKGYIPLKVAYECAVGTLEPEARPGDEFLTALAVDVSKEDDPKGSAAKTERAAYARIDDAELQIESLLRDALAKAELPTFVEVAGRLELIRNTEVWRDKPVRIEGAVSLDNIFAPYEPQMAFVEEGQFDRWLSKVREGRRQSLSNDEALSLIRHEIEKHGGFLSQEKGAQIVRKEDPSFRKKRAMELVKQVTGNENRGPRGPRRKLCG